MSRSPLRDFLVGCFVLAGLGAIVFVVFGALLIQFLPDIAPIVARILKTDEPDKMQALIEKLNS